MKVYKELGLRRMSQDKLEDIAKERLGIDVDLDRDRDMLIDAIMSSQPDEEPSVDVLRINTMNDLARRIWEGQSISEPLNWRVMRIKEGLTHHGYDDLFEHLELPEKGFKKYM